MKATPGGKAILQPRRYENSVPQICEILNLSRVNKGRAAEQLEIKTESCETVAYKHFFFCSLILHVFIYRGADKSLARPGRKQATATEDFDVHISYF